jgi:hypothetical protein
LDQRPPVTRKVQLPMSALSKHVGQSKPDDGDQKLLLQVLRVEVIKAQLIANQLTSIGVALKQKAIDVEGALSWARDEGLIDLLQFPTKGDVR